ncbi:LysR family transcriptional regulator [Bosea caraganae]|nr:LysR family transcriptional regulator [Bosea caraganae]
MSEQHGRSLSTTQIEVLHSLLQTRSLSVTGSALGLTQSAISHVLAGLRRHFGDELLLRRGRGMVLTPFAASIQEPVGSVLRQIEDVSGLREAFEPQALTRRCVIAARDLTLSIVAPALLRRFAEQAPRASISIVSWESTRIADQLASGACDFAIGVDPPLSDMGLRIQKLYEDDFVAVSARKAEAAGPLTIDDLVRRPAILVSRTDAIGSPVDDALAAQGLRRHVVMRSAYFLSAMSIVRDADLLMVVPRRIALKHAADFDLEISELPLKLLRYSVFGVGHERFAASPLYKWLRSLCVEAVKEAVGQLGGRN